MRHKGGREGIGQKGKERNNVTEKGKGREKKGKKHCRGERGDE